MRGFLLGWIAALCMFGVASAAPPPLSAYGALPAFEKAAMSPSGKLLAVVATVEDQRRLVVFDDHSTPVLVAPLGDAKLRRIAWAGEDYVLVWFGTTESLGPQIIETQTELTDVLVAPLNHKKPWRIFDGNTSILGGVRSTYGILQRNGHWYGYFGGITLEAYTGGDEFYVKSGNPEPYEVDLDTRTTRRLAQRSVQPDTERSWIIGDTGKIIASMDYVARSGDWKIADAKGQNIASGVDPLGEMELIGQGRTAGTILYGKADSESVYHWFEQSLAGGPSAEILAEQDASTTLADPRTGQLIGWAGDGDNPQTHFLDARREKVMRATERAFHGVNVELIDWNDAFDKLIVHTSGLADPGTWWRIDINTGFADQIGSSYLIAPKDVGPMRMVSYKAADGTALEGVLTLPPHSAGRMLPAIMFPHGGPASRDDAVFDWWAQAFAARGYAVFQPNFRGSSGYGAAFERAGDGQWGRAMQTDISDGLAELVRQGVVDPKRVCIMGGSYGGYAALAGVTLQKGLYRCAVSVAGVSDVQAMSRLELEDSRYNHALYLQLKRQRGAPDSLKSISPVAFAGRADAPILLIHGKDDTVVDYSQSVAMERALKQQGKSVEFVTLPGEDHWLSRSATRLQMLTAADSFIERYNPPDATPAALTGR
jgi:acetyl esterase/lipase